VGLAYNEDFQGAEEMLGQITDIREETEARIRQAMEAKHTKERDNLESRNRQAFEEFIIAWDGALKNFQEVS
jgi:hypothetical protein